MSRARAILPGTVYHSVRRCTERLFKLTPNHRPSRQTPHSRSTVASLYLYATAKYAIRYGVSLLAACVMGNHVHEILYDRDGQIPAFLRDRNALFARMVKRFYGLSDGIFERKQAEYFPLETSEDLARAIAYVLANPVRAKLVARPEDWPGFVTSDRCLMPRTLEISRPEELSPTGRSRSEATLPLVIGIPDSLEYSFGPREQLQRIASARMHELCAARTPGDVAGRDAVLATPPMAAPAVRGASKKHAKPVAYGIEQRARSRQALERRQLFLASYSRALAEVRAGHRDVVFPPGTWKMHMEYGYPRASAATMAA